jgi:sulfatase maturation enzyme AslB (radical SAM superfamily)
MDLIIKPTQRCNFSCTFCSSTEIAKSNKPIHDLDIVKVERFLDRFPNTQTIIVNGGDPLMVDPDYYWQIIDMLEKRGMTNCTISFTTNLWDWWLHPTKWDELFRHPQVQICTSFHYGDSRQIRPGQILTEEIFLQLITKFKQDFGYYPSYIAVITEENKHLAINNVRLAKWLGIQCKINYAMASGREGKPFPLGDIYKIYMDIYEEGLAPWEHSTTQMLARLKYLDTTTCPQNRKCDEGIRNLQPVAEDGYEYGSCGSLGDDREFPIDFEKEMAGEFFTPLQDTWELQFQKEDCLSCPNFNICNGCYKTVKDLKEAGLVEHSCKLMKEFRQRARDNGITEY